MENQSCAECHKPIVHPMRKYKVCLDFFIDWCSQLAVIPEKWK